MEWEVDEKISEIQSQLTKSQMLEPDQLSGQIVRDRKTFDWTVTISPISEIQALYRVDITLAWKQGRKMVKTSRSAYLLPPHLKEYNEENFT